MLACLSQKTSDAGGGMNIGGDGPGRAAGGCRRSGRLRRRVAGLIAGGLALLSAPQAFAQTFDCADGDFYQIRGSGSSSILSIVNRENNPYTLDTLYSASTLLNGLGYNPADDYLYAISSSGRQLYRLGSSGVLLSAITVSGLPTNSSPTLDAGTFDLAGNYWVAHSNGAIYRIDGVTGAAPSPSATLVSKVADTSPPTGYTGVTSLLVGDWAVSPAESTTSYTVIYGLRSAESGTVYLYRVAISNPGTATEASVSRRAITGITIGNAIGTVYLDANNVLYAYDNAASTTSGFYSIDVATGLVTAVSGSASTSQSDGAVCPLAEAQVQPTIVLNKITTGAAGGAFGFTLTNTGQATGTVTTTAADTSTQVDGDTSNTGDQPFTVSAFSTAVTITEDELSGWSLADATCSLDGGGTVGSFDSATRSYTLPASAMVSGAEFTCTFTNEADEVDLAIEKTADVTTATSGDSITYTLVVTNNGPDAVTGAVVTDVPGTGLTCASDNAVTCTSSAATSACPAGTLTVQNLLDGVALGALGDDETATFTFTCTVD
ncbi:MAG: DUF11 domain-containing protein [Pseudoxanthomonas sp.]